MWTLNLFYLEFAELLGCVDACFSPTMESLGPLFLQIFFLLLFFLLLRLPVFACLVRFHRPLWLPSLSPFFLRDVPQTGLSQLTGFKFTDSSATYLGP